MGNWTKRPYRNDQDSKRKGTELPSTTQIIHLFRLHYTPDRNVQHRRSDFFDLKRENGETAADVWKRILEIEKNCEFENITAAELLASKFLSLIGKSTGDYELKKKIRKGDMSVEAITDAIHEYMYEKLNDSPETDEEKKIRHVEKRKFKPTKEQTEKTQNSEEWTATDAEPPIGLNNTNVRREKKNVPNAVNLDTSPNAAVHREKSTI